MLFFRTKILPPVVFLFLYAGFACVLTQAQTSNVTVRVMASNLSSGNNQRYGNLRKLLFWGSVDGVCSV